MERVSGIPISNVDALREAGIDLRALAERGVEIFFTQLMRHNFFHADMHPGNIFVDRGHPERPSYIAVDFGIMGSLSKQDQRYLAENFLAFFNRDYRRVAELHVESKWVPPDTRIDDFEAQSAASANRFRSAAEGNLVRAGPRAAVPDRAALSHGGAAAARAAAEDTAQCRRPRATAVPGSRSVGDGEAVPRSLDCASRSERERCLREITRKAPSWGETLPALPGLAYETLKMARAGELEVHMRSEGIDRIRGEIRRANRRTVLATIGAALIVGGNHPRSRRHRARHAFGGRRSGRGFSPASAAALRSQALASGSED